MAYQEWVARPSSVFPVSPSYLDPCDSAEGLLAPRKRGRPRNARRSTSIIDQYERRKVSNRLAAQRCRARKLEEKRLLEEKIIELESVVESLKKQLRKRDLEERQWNRDIETLETGHRSYTLQQSTEMFHFGKKRPTSLSIGSTSNPSHPSPRIASVKPLAKTCASDFDSFDFLEPTELCSSLTEPFTSTILSAEINTSSMFPTFSYTEL